MRIEEFPKSIGYSTTAVLLVGFTEEGTAAFTNGKNVDHTVVVIPLSVQLKVHTYIDKVYIVTQVDRFSVMVDLLTWWLRSKASCMQIIIDSNHYMVNNINIISRLPLTSFHR